MKESFWGLFVVIIGIVGISIINVFQTITTTGNHDYFLLKEVTEASMMDAVDLGYYRIHGEVKIIKEKFIENFLRRFSESFGRSGEREIVFYHINELPPKVSIGLDAEFDAKIYNTEAVDFTLPNNITGILEMKFPFQADKFVVEPPNMPGQFSAPKTNIQFKHNENLTVKWGATSSWGTPSNGSNYRLEYKCGTGDWVPLVNTGTNTSYTHKVSCQDKTLQYRVRAESEGGQSEWRYSDTAKQVRIEDYQPVSLNYTGKEQQYKVPETGLYRLEVWGAQGEGNRGGKGGYSKGEIKLNEGEILHIYVGDRSGYNGGGIGGYNGGGATDIRKGGMGLNHRIIVAGGGGGQRNHSSSGNGGAGGGLTGGDGTGVYGGPGGGGTQTKGGQPRYTSHTGYNPGGEGTLGQGGNGAHSGTNHNAGGGGGGYYGGAGGSTDYPRYRDNDDHGGGGGSGYIGGVMKGSMQTGVNSGNGKAKITLIGL